ncbi:MAG: hypothetical protein KAU03_04525 [Candidatus Altiarchaeales archaeon]|nr:hypothetical protein [Candidatus Altiarchaeales archaeon]
MKPKATPKSNKIISLILLIATSILLLNPGCINQEKPTIIGEITKTPQIDTTTTQTPTTTTSTVETTTVKETTTINYKTYQNAFKTCDIISHTDILDQCYTIISNEADNPRICNLINQANYKKYCLATTQNNPTLCDKITKPYLKVKCLTHISQAKNNPGLCQNISPRDAADWCLIWNALKTSNKKLCQEIDNKNMMRFCEAGLDMNPTPCYGITKPTIRGLCITNVAWRSRNTSHCEKISGTDRIDRCYIAMAQRMRDPTLCNKINDRNHLKFCNAVIEKDIEKCKTISKLRLAEECYAKIAHLTLQPTEKIDSWVGFT